MPEFACPFNEICRPTFWNIPEFFQVAIYIVSALVAAFFVYGFYRHVRIWRRGRGKFSCNQFGQRTLNFLTFGAATRKVVFDKQPAGFMHVNIMWGLVILFLGTALATIDWEFMRLLFNARLLQGGFYFFYKATLDIFGVLAILGLSIALTTRYVQRPKRLNGMSGGRFFNDDLWTVGALCILVITGFMLESLRIAGMSLEWAREGRGALWFAQYSIVGNALAQLWLPLGENAIRSWHLGVWLFHASLTLVWLAAIPFTKTFHIFSSSINTFFKRLEPRGAILKIENLEEQESFGVGKLEEFTWKQILDFDACTRCGRCQDECPASITGKALSPKNIMVKMFDLARTDAKTPQAVHGAAIDAQELWDCTTCMACVNACPVAIDQLGTIIDLRRYLTLSEGTPQSPSNKAMDSMERQGNPYGLPKADRLKWAEGMDVPRAKAGEEYDLLFWVGCAGSYDQRAQKITRAFAKIMQSAGLKIAVMEEERCNCESARRLGNEYLYQTATAENVGNLNKLTFKRIVTTCPHCFNTIKNEYPQFDAKYEIVHHTQLIAELIGNGRIVPKRSLAQSITYHDSCYLGRYNDIYDPQRVILQSLTTGNQLVEMPRSRSKGLCCGGGGGRMWLEENTGTRINQRRVQDVLDVKAQMVASACPFCMTMLEDGAKALSVDEQLARKDIAELVAEAL